jgi:nitrogen fixation/metabolism regulation signal transduction histidine kinase
VAPQRDDEVGRAIQAFNDMADTLQESTDRLVYLRQLESWQVVARKTAHEVKNSLTPIRLTVEEMLARYDDADRAFMCQATQIVVDEIETLERRVRAFSQFAAEPPVSPAPLDVNSLLQERIALLRTAHPEVAYECRLAEVPQAMADADLVKGILTNLLENAADAAGHGGRLRWPTRGWPLKCTIPVRV